MIDYTLVCGVDDKHLRQLALTWPTWRKWKPSLLEHPMLVFYDYAQVSEARVRAVVDHPDLHVIAWTPSVEEFRGWEQEGRFGDPQRYKMLAGFVHVAGLFVNTDYWLKLDTDVVATGMDDWIDPIDFSGSPAIVAHRWSFTKPADQMARLDWWAKDVPEFIGHDPLNLKPAPGADRVGHSRIISWCGFFLTEFTQLCSRLAIDWAGHNMLPVPSQDGYMWYVATRMGLGVKRINAKNRGWEHWSTEQNILKAVVRAMA